VCVCVCVCVCVWSLLSSALANTLDVLDFSPFGPHSRKQTSSNGFDPLQTAIMTAIKSAQSEKGMSVMDLVSAMKGRYTEPQIRCVCE
jgi:cell division ATPase FtsA